MSSTFSSPKINPANAVEELAAEREAHAGTKARLKLLEHTVLQFVPRDLISFLGKGSLLDVELGDQVEKTMSIVFTDIRDFTTLSESMTPQQTFNMINSYLSVMNPVISTHQGIIDKYMGDAIMALFPTSADDALSAALAMLARLDEYNNGRSRAAYPPIRIGIGVNTGLLMLGVIGGGNRMEGTVISHAVNLASRLETLTKTYGVPLLISEHTLYSLSDAELFSVRYLGRSKVAENTPAESVYEVFDHDTPKIKELKIKSLKKFEEAVAYYHTRAATKALPMLEEIVRENPGDNPARVYLKRCLDYIKTGVYIGTEELPDEIIWRKEHEVGIEEIDRQLHELFTLIRNLHEAVSVENNRDAISSAMDILERRIQEHFEFEDELMTKHYYPFSSDHIAQHNSYKYYFYKLKDEIETNIENSLYLGFRINLSLANWLLNHLSRDDRHLGRFLNERGCV
ncbi:MAG: adenylate/guanylate cyclase domain-containing protein [Gallionella sp.]|nr:adenylate/guanylate cyclase domain-containing protein [Gallionella sp.]